MAIGVVGVVSRVEVTAVAVNNFSLSFSWSTVSIKEKKGERERGGRVVVGVRKR